MIIIWAGVSYRKIGLGIFLLAYCTYSTQTIVCCNDLATTAGLGWYSLNYLNYS